MADSPGRHTPLIIRGIYGGVMGGIALAVFLIIIAALLARDPWISLRGLATVILGSGAVFTSGFVSQVISVSLAFILVAGGILGLVFIALVGRLLTANAITIGVLFALVAWIILQLFIIPRYAPFILFTVPPLVLALGFAIYGLVLGAIYRLLTPVGIHYHHRYVR